MNVSVKPIGTMKSLFHYKNGTPRQASVCHNAPGILTVEKSVFNNPEHSLEGLEDYSHAWVIFVFHKNNNSHTKAKVKPPRLDGKRTGVFSSRSPYRPNNIGLSLLKIDKIEGASVHFSGVDMIDGTPVLDIKPYIPEYDSPASSMFYDNKLPPLSVKENDLAEKSCEALSFNELGCKNSNENNNVKTNSAGNVLEKGFFTLSSALHKAGNFFASHSYDKQEDVLCEESRIKAESNCSEPDFSVACANDKEFSGCDDAPIASSKVEYSSDDVKGAAAGADEDLDVFLGAVLSQAVESLSSELTLHQDNDSTACNLLGVLESAESKQINHSSQKAGSEEQKSSSHQHQTLHDSNQTCVTRESNSDKNFPSTAHPVIAPWLLNPPVKKLRVTFTTEALQQLQQFSSSSPDADYRLQLLSNTEEAKSAIRDVLHEEPRSVYRRQHCQDSLYFFTVDIVHITCWFDEDIAQVVRLKPVAHVSKLQRKLE